MRLALIVLTAAAATLLVLHVLMRLAPALKLLDHPGGRKNHGASTPLVGGIAIACTLLAGLAVINPASGVAMALATVMLIAIGVADDRHEISPFPRLAVQAATGMVMILLGQVQLRTVGDLFGFGPVGLWVFVVPITIFATIGVINAVNMVDGLDGHSSIAILVALAAYAFVAHDSRLGEQYLVLLVLLGAMIAFLLLNLRGPWQRRARVFLGDAGSMLMGFLLAWFAIDLSNGPGRTFAPICALWVLIIPLCDCVSLMLRRHKTGLGAFNADRQHLHHWLLDRGYTVSQTNLVMLLASSLCALVGIAGWKYNVPEPLLFAGFVALFLTHHLYMSHYFRERDVMTTGMHDFPDEVIKQSR